MKVKHKIRLLALLLYSANSTAQSLTDSTVRATINTNISDNIDQLITPQMIRYPMQKMVDLTMKVSGYVNGNWGLGTGVPTSRLHVLGNMRIDNTQPILYMKNGANTDVSAFTLTSDNWFKVGNGAVQISPWGGLPTLFVGNNNGNVGVGGEASGAKHHVFGLSKVTLATPHGLAFGITNPSGGAFTHQFLNDGNYSGTGDKYLFGAQPDDQRFAQFAGDVSVKGTLFANSIAGQDGTALLPENGKNIGAKSFVMNNNVNNLGYNFVNLNTTGGFGLAVSSRTANNFAFAVTDATNAFYSYAIMPSGSMYSKGTKFIFGDLPDDGYHAQFAGTLRAYTVVSVRAAGGGEARYHLYNSGGMAEWKFGQKTTTNHDFNISKLVSGVESDYLSITTTGNVGMGTTTPTSKLQVAGDVTATGVILTAPNGSKWKVTVNNNGNLITTAQ